MHLEDLNDIISQHPALDAIRHTIIKRNNTHLLLSGLHASSRAFILSNHLSKEGVWVIVMDNADDAQYMYADIKTLLQAQDIYYFPNSHRRRQGKDEAMAVQRTEVLSALLNAMHSLEDASLQDGSKTAYSLKARPIIVTYPEALAESVPQPQSLQGNTITLSVGEEITISQLTAMLLELDLKIHPHSSDYSFCLVPPL